MVRALHTHWVQFYLITMRTGKGLHLIHSHDRCKSVGYTGHLEKQLTEMETEMEMKMEMEMLAHVQ